MGATLGGVPFLFDPSEVSWFFDVKAKEIPTVGGKVVQVYGTTLSDMTVTGTFGFGDRDHGDEAGWEYQLRFLAQVKRWAEQGLDGGAPLRFLYPSYKWDFHVYVRDFTSPRGPAVVTDAAEFNPGWSLVLFIFQDNTKTVVRGIRDLYISRLVAGVGWKASEYNGPRADQVEAMLTSGGYTNDAQGIQGYIIDKTNSIGAGAEAP